MAYASLIDVERLDGRVTFSDKPPVTATDVIGFLGDTAAELDGLFAAMGYSVPIPGSASQGFRLAQTYNARGANAMAQAAWPDSPTADDAQKLWDATLKMLRDGKVKLPDAPLDTDNVQLRVRAATGDDSATRFFYRSSRF